MGSAYPSPPRSDCNRDSGYESDAVLSNSTSDPATPPITVIEENLRAAWDALQLLESRSTYAESCPTLQKLLCAAIPAGTECKHVSSNNPISVLKAKKPAGRFKSGRRRGRPPGKSSRPYGFYKGMTAAEIRKSKKADAAAKAAVEAEQHEAEQHGRGSEQQEGRQLESEHQGPEQSEIEQISFEQDGIEPDDTEQVGTKGHELSLLLPLAQPDIMSPKSDTTDDGYWSLPIHLPYDNESTQQEPKQPGIEQNELTLCLSEDQEKSVLQPWSGIFDDGYEGLPSHLLTNAFDSSEDTSTTNESISASSVSTWSDSTNDSTYRCPPQAPSCNEELFQPIPASTSKEYNMYTPTTSPMGMHDSPRDYGLACMTCNDWRYHYGKVHFPRGTPIQLYGCGHTACKSCLTERYNLNERNDLCITCPVCNSFTGFLSFLAPVGPAHILDMLAQARAIPSGYFTRQSIILDRREAIQVLGLVYTIVSCEYGSEEALGTAHMSAHSLLRGLERYFEARQLNDAITTEQLRTALECCIESVMFDKLLLRPENRHLKRSATLLRYKRLVSLIPEVARNEPGLQFVMQLWRHIIGWVVEIMRLRWEQRF